VSEGQWKVPGATKDRQSITADGNLTGVRLIDGVTVHEVRNVPKNNGHLTEIFRCDWFGGVAHVDHVFAVVLEPRGISAWHAHATTTDRIFIPAGIVHIVLYDGREGSPTFGAVNEFRFGTIRPALVVVPPRIWHGVRNIGSVPATVLNLPDAAYEYEDPDHWRVPVGSAAIPFKWSDDV
jgi:dTDP-4-dehydrorhamnose 3,5-epimerase